MYPWDVNLTIVTGGKPNLTGNIKVLADDCDQAIRKAKAKTILKADQKFGGSTTQRAD